MGEVNIFLNELIDRDVVSLGILEGEIEVYRVEEVRKKISEIGVIEVIDTYWDNLIFKAKDNELYELMIM